MNDDQRWLMPPAELAAVILPFFSSWEPRAESEVRRNIVAWLSGQTDKQLGHVSYFSARKVFESPAVRAVGEALQHLERACLLMRAIDGGQYGGCYVGLTRLGMHALQTNTVRQHLGLGDAPLTT